MTLELGGNDAAIVLDDVDPKAIAPQLFRAAFANCGQICVAIKRLYVPESIYEPMCEALAEIARSIKVGDGLDPESQMGPLQNKMQYDKVLAILEDTRKAGARILCGGHALDRPGYFIAPAIVADIAEGTRLVDEEPFGPVLPVIKYRDLDDAIRRANDTRYGLSGSVWTNDLARGAEIAARLEVGTAYVNQHHIPDATVPFGGAKESGPGARVFCAGAQELHGSPGRQRGATPINSSYLNEIAGSRFSVRVAGSMVMPTDSRAVTPRIGSTPSGPKMTRPAVISPMNSIWARPNGYSCTLPSASS